MHLEEEKETPGYGSKSISRKYDIAISQSSQQTIDNGVGERKLDYGSH